MNKRADLPNSSTEFFVNVLLIETQAMEHANEEAVLLLSVVLAFVGPVCDPQLSTENHQKSCTTYQCVKLNLCFIMN